ncbi:hypothetical protein D9M69_647520 [compost metagenome]
MGAATARYCATGTSYPDSFAVGVSGRKVLRSSAKTRSGETLPALICGIASPSWMVASSTWLPRTAVSAGLPLSNGTSVPLTLACLNSTVWASWLPVPTPVVPKVMLRPAPVTSLIVLKPDFSLATST